MPMAQSIINIDGVIGDFDFWGDGSNVSLAKVRGQLEAATNKDVLVNINSPGGDIGVGFAIYDLLKTSDKNITTKTTGLCASIATVIQFAGDVRIMTENSEFMIHNPYYENVKGDAEELREYADQIEETETRIKDFYSEFTELSVDILDGLMKDTTWLTPEEALEFGFITEILKGEDENTSKALTKVRKLEISTGLEVRAVAFINSKKIAMDNKKKGLMAKIRAGMKNLAGAKNTEYTLDDGAKINTDADGDIEVGQTVTGDDEQILSAGDYLLDDGRTVVIGEEGVVSEVKEVEADPANDEENNLVLEAVTTIQEGMATVVENMKTLTDSVKEINQIAVDNQTAIAGIGNGVKPVVKKNLAKNLARQRNLGGVKGGKQGQDMNANRKTFKENHPRPVL